jgi:signal transduction histidine kinase
VRAAAARTGSEQRSPLYAFGERAHGWAVVPVRSGGRVVGTVAQLLRVGDNPAIERLVRALIDDDARVLFTSLGTTQWITSRGHPAPAPFTAPAEDGRARHVGTGDDESIAAAYTLAPSPWRIVLYQTTDSVLRRPYQFLRRILVAGLLALAVAGAGAWLLGRHLTRPLREVTDAAAALSRGDYSRRVRVTGGGLEVETLASTFNAMAARIGDAHDALAERNAELQRANAAKAQFLAMMSHELRTPLNAIGGFTELLELGLRGPVTAEQIEDLGRIRRNKDLLLAIISDIHVFARADAGALAVARETLRIAPLLRGVTEMVGPQMVAKGVRLVCPPVAEDLVALGDRERVQQVVLNLLSNAIKFTEPGGEVVVDTAALDGEVRIAVRDTGAGIHADQLETIFEPFVQLDASLTRRAGGTGLGLAISRQLAHAMGGTLSVESTVGVGSTFTLSLASGTPKHGGAELRSGEVGRARVEGLRG